MRGQRRRAADINSLTPPPCRCCRCSAISSEQPAALHCHSRYAASVAARPFWRCPRCGRAVGAAGPPPLSRCPCRAAAAPALARLGACGCPRRCLPAHAVITSVEVFPRTFFVFPALSTTAAVGMPSAGQFGHEVLPSQVGDDVGVYCPPVLHEDEEELDGRPPLVECSEDDEREVFEHARNDASGAAAASDSDSDSAGLPSVFDDTDSSTGSSYSNLFSSFFVVHADDEAGGEGASSAKSKDAGRGLSGTASVGGAGSGQPSSAPIAPSSRYSRRNDKGVFVGASRQRPKQQTPAFSVIEAIHTEVLDCRGRGADGSTTDKTACRTRVRCAVHGDTRCTEWRIRGPVMGVSTDAEYLTTVATVRAAADVPRHEVYVRALPHLVGKAYKSTTMAYQSVRFVALAASVDDATWDSSPAFRVVDRTERLDDKVVRGILKSAAVTVANRKCKHINGHVSLLSITDARGDKVHKTAVRAARRQRSVRALHDWRRKVYIKLASRRVNLLKGVSAGAIVRFRRLREPEDRHDGRRSLRIRISRGLSQMRLLPTREQLRRVRREDFDNPGRTRHFLFTKRLLGNLERWEYVIGSSTEGIRRYMAADGRMKRLRAHTNRYWDARRRAQADEDDTSEPEDNGIFFNNANTEHNGTYAPVETDPARLEELLVCTSSLLEGGDGVDPIPVIAVGYDVISALQNAVDAAAIPGITTEDVAKEPHAVITFAADGGSVRRQDLTAFTLSLSSPTLENGRTSLTPIVYVLAGEKKVDRAVKDNIREMISQVMAAAFSIPVVAATVSDTSAAPSARTRLVLDQVVQTCGTFHGRRWSSYLCVRACCSCRACASVSFLSCCFGYM